jgi:argininosuccinate lyase
VAVLTYPDAFADTSSAMPQKKNPDPLELVRARAGTVSGELSGALAIVHGLGGGYSRDLQELKVLLWRALATVRDSAEVTALVVAGLGVRRGRGAEIVGRGFATAMDLADRLSLERGVPFRRAHFAVGRLVRALSDDGRTFAQTGAAEASRVLSEAAGRPVPIDERTWRDWTDAAARAASRRTAGGPGDLPGQLSRARRHLDEQHARLRVLAAREARARKLLLAAVARSIKAR